MKLKLTRVSFLNICLNQTRPVGYRQGRVFMLYCSYKDLLWPFKNNKRLKKVKHQKNIVDFLLQATHVGRVGDELSQEDLFVGVEGVDDQRHKLSDLRLEGKGLRLLLHGLVVCFRHLDGGNREMSACRKTDANVIQCTKNTLNVLQ